LLIGLRKLQGMLGDNSNKNTTGVDGVGQDFNLLDMLPVTAYGPTPLQHALITKEKGALKLKILYAEDEERLQKSTAMLMSCWGYDFDLASNGQDVVEYAKANEGGYDLCLMDVDMPIMNGCEATEMIRQKFQYFPIMGLSGNPQYKDKCLEIGMDDFLSKPCSPDELLAKINELTVKFEKLCFKDETIFLKKEMPMDQQHAQELRELKKQDLIKVKFDDVSGSEVVVHKNIINKIVQDFNIKKQFVSTFINRNPEKPTKCILFGNNCRMPQMYLDGEDYEGELQAENEEVKKYPSMILKAEEK